MEWFNRVDDSIREEKLREILKKSVGHLFPFNNKFIKFLNNVPAPIFYIIYQASQQEEVILDRKQNLLLPLKHPQFPNTYSKSFI